LSRREIEKNKGIIVIVVAFLCLGSVYAYFWMGGLADEAEETEIERVKEVIEVPFLEFEGVSIHWLGIGGFKLKHEETVVYIDPKDIFLLDDPLLEKADYIVITHYHTPHYSPLDVEKLSDEDTILITSKVTGMAGEPEHIVFPEDSLEFDDVAFDFVASYNVDKRRPTGDLFHPPSNDDIGVIVDFGVARVYHSGDTDRIPAMQGIVTDIALLPVSGYAWMTAEEAAGAAEDIMISSDLIYAVPMHYGINQGTRYNANVFSRLANCSVAILERLIY
jgi:L-ascorbate metabolism protein UlaG (beta-lactamase superfamily)